MDSRCRRVRRQSRRPRPSQRPGVVDDEIRWQFDHMSAEVRAAPRALPPVGEDSCGPLGPGLLASGQLRGIIAHLQAGLAGTDSEQGIPSAPMEPTIYAAMGGADAVLALAEAWHRRCLADPIVAHPFEGGIHPEHTSRLAAYWSEQLGGPATYTESIGDYSQVVRMHTGNGPHEQMDGRAVAAFVLALDDAAIPSDPGLRFQLIAWFTWATAMLNHRWTTPDQVPPDLPLPAWGWNGTEG